MTRDLDFAGKSLLVIGGSSGIGNGIAQAFRSHGAGVTVSGTRSASSDYKIDEGSDLHGLDYVQLDATNTQALDSFALPTPALDILVLSQGTVLYDRGEFSADGFRKVLDINLNSLMTCALRFHAALAASRGSLIIISSTAAYHATKGNPAYNASKAGAVALTRTLGQAWARDGIRVNGIAPGLVDSKLTKVTTANPKRLDAALREIPLHRLGTPADIAGTALFLASPLSSYIIGQTIIVDGGLLL